MSGFDEIKRDASLEWAHKHSSHHREEVLGSEMCGCFYCLAIFGPDEIDVWVDSVNGVGQTALCPRCSVDSIIGSASGFPITQEFLEQMHRRWF